MKRLILIKKLKSIVFEKNLRILLKSKWVIYGIGPLITLLAAALVIWVGNVMTTHPAICLSCHARQSSIPMWAPSQIHPEKVSCVDCHAKPGKWFPMSFYADERVNDNCLHCHPKIAKNEKAEAHHMKIAHKLHIEDSKLMCIDCHRNIAHEKMEAGANRPRRTTCIECHPEVIEGGPESCTKCHTKIPVKSS